jgi:hypothetical protein
MAEARETYERIVTPDELVKMANEMYAEVKKTPDEKRAELFQHFFISRREICVAYPMVIKMMCYLTLYNSAVFKKYIILSAKMPRKTQEEYHEIQVKYVKMLHRKLYPRESPEYFRRLHANALRLLKDEAEDHEARLKEAEEITKKKEEQYMVELRKELKQKAETGQLPGEGPIIVDSAERGAAQQITPEENNPLTRRADSLLI